MIEVTAGIYRLPLPVPVTTLGHIKPYLVKGDDGHLLIDTGWNTSESLALLKKQLAEGGVKGKEISQIVVTHAHPDHYGLAGKLKKLFGGRLDASGIFHYSDSTGLAPPSGQHLGFKNDRLAEFPGDNGSLLGRGSDFAIRNGNTISREPHINGIR